MRRILTAASTLIALATSPQKTLADPSLPIGPLHHAAPYHCTEFWQYGRNDFVQGHCAFALETMQESDVTHYTDTRIEFLAPGTSSTQSTAISLATPRKYSLGTCTIAVVLIDTVFPAGQIPKNLLPVDHWSREISTFARLEAAAKLVLQECVGLRHQFGVMVDGENEHALGVFVWRTGSWLDETFKRAVDVRLKNATASRFGTSILT